MHASNLPVTYTHIHCKHAYSHTRKYRTDLQFHIKVPQIWVNYGMLKSNLFLIEYFSSSVFWSFFFCSESSKLLPTPIYPTLCSFSLSFKKGREKQTKPSENVLVCNPQQHNENQISRRPITQKNVLTKQCDRKHSQKYHCVDQILLGMRPVLQCGWYFHYWNDTLLEKTDFSFASEYQLQIAS